MPSNEALKLLESVLNESKNYRKYSELMSRKFNELSSKYELAKRANDKEGMKKILKDVHKYQKLGAEVEPYYISDYKSLNSEIYDKETAKSEGDDYKKLNKEYKRIVGSARPKNVGIHNIINRNTEDFDTTDFHDVKKEAALILIEALNTLLNE